MTVKPSAIELNGKQYALAEGPDAFQIRYEAALIQRREVAGTLATRDETARSTILEWNWDDWSLGEGQKWIQTNKGPDTFRKYLLSGGAVDIRTDGQIRLGLALSSDLEIADVDHGPHLCTAGRPVAAWSQAAGGEKWNRRDSGSWGTAASTGNGAALQGQIEPLNNKVFIPSRTDIVRVNAANAPASGTTWQNFSADGCLVSGSADGNRLYFIDRTAGENVILKVVDTSPASGAPFTPTTLATIGGWDQGEGLASDGPNVYALLGVDNERLGIFTIAGTDTTTFKEFVRLPDDFRIPVGTRRQMVTLNGVVFVGGFFDDPFDNEDQAALIWATSQGSSSWRIRERGTSEQVRALSTTIDNQVLMGTNKGKVYAYNMNTGGFYEFASGLATTDLVQSFTYDAGQYFVATFQSGGTGEIFATLTSGSGKYPSSVKVEGSRWNFDTTEQKALLTVTVEGIFPTNTSADFSFETDDGSEVTTDSAGTTMTANSTGQTTFTISDADTERRFRWLKPNVTLKTSDTSVTPIIQAVRSRATTTSKEKFILCTVDLNSRRENQRVPSRAITGAAAAAELEALAEDDSNVVVEFKAYHEKAGGTHPRTTDTYNVIIDDTIIDLPEPGRGTAVLRMRVV